VVVVQHYHQHAICIPDLQLLENTLKGDVQHSPSLAATNTPNEVTASTTTMTITSRVLDNETESVRDDDAKGLNVRTAMSSSFYISRYLSIDQSTCLISCREVAVA
jgi:hypothetical protein